jgi:predicted transposase/invertase (TIGR01784 family)
VNDKLSILDIRATGDDGRIYDIEVQSLGNEEYINRSLYYWARIYSGQLGESENYGTLNPVICINLCDFVVIKDLTALHTCYMPIEKDNPEYALTDHFEIHFIEMPKFIDKNPELFDTLDMWIKYFLSEGKDEKEDEAMKIILKNNTFQKARNEYKRFTADEKYRHAYEARQKWLRDERSLLDYARRDGEKQGIKKGIEQGIEQGLKQKAVETAIALLNESLSIEKIASITGLSEEEVKKLQ